MLRATLLLLPLAALAQPPVIPVGPDAYRMWERWAYQRIGARAYMRSTYDRRGGNESADASHFLYQLADDFNVSLDVQGPGVLYFVRYNHWHGSPWHYEVDGTDHIVRETSTADPLHPAPNSVFLPERLFPAPLAWTWAETKGADLSWIPIGFEKSFRMAYSRTFYGTGYYIYQQYVPGAGLSQPIRRWDGQTPPDPEVLKLIARTGTDLAPAAGTQGIREQSGRLDVPAGASVPVWNGHSRSMVRALEFSVPLDQAQALSAVRLRVTWDGRAAPSIDAPLALFFGTGLLYNRDHREYLVKSFPIVVRYSTDRVYLSSYYPMPFFRSARIELAGAGKAVTDLRWKIRIAPFRDPANQVGYFHATYRDHPTPQPGKDLVLLDTKDVEGGGDWSGQFVGTSFIFSHDAVLNTLEGDPRFFFDDSRTPQGQGTGTEEWGGGGDYWGGENMTLPFAGHPTGAKSAKEAVSAEDKIESAYRFLLADLMPFGRNARIQLEHGGVNESTEHYETVTYWYGLPAASLVETDALAIGDPASEQAHDYVSPDASAPYTLTSRYEWGPDTLQGAEIYPAETDRGRTTKGTSEFTLKVSPANVGVMLRRKLDYGFPNQRAEVFVQAGNAWKPAGVWYLAGSNTCVFSNPGNRQELGATQHVVEISNRRFRDDEFLIPRALTAGRSSIRVRVRFTPVATPLFPGYPLPDLAWSEMRYTAYSFVMPKFKLP
jgi:D-arabinan exo alpha-(1,3)/(1,5)-arabinofuranosidase (non-reducing end)